jgi:hypothetical protein
MNSHGRAMRAWIQRQQQIQRKVLGKPVPYNDPILSMILAMFRRGAHCASGFSGGKKFSTTKKHQKN